MQHLFSTFPQFVDEELKRRRAKPNQNRPRNLQKPKSPWMRMTSGYEEDGERKVLMGGDLNVGENLKFGFEGLYEESAPTGEKFRPKPTLDSISVDEQLESFECTVEWTANSIHQLERLFPFFMNVGTTVVVDWGWDDVPPGGILDVSDVENLQNQYRTINAESDSSDVQSSNSNVSPGTVSPFDHPKYQQLKKGEGRYSFVAGTIADFSFSPEGNSQYSCTTEVMSISKAMSKLRTHGQENSRDPEEQTDEKPKIKKSLMEFKNQDFVNYLNNRAEDGDKDVIRFDVGGEFNRREDTESEFTYYLSWKEIETIANRHTSYVKNSDGDGDAKTRANGEIRSYEFDSASSIISSFKTGKTDKEKSDAVELRTLDPLVCIFDVNGVSDRFRTFSEKGPEVSKQVNRDIDPKREGFLYNLYIEWQLVKEAFDRFEYVTQSVQYILEKCSVAAFNIWEFDSLIDSHAIKFFDLNMTDNTVKSILDTEGEEFVFRPTTRDTIMRDFNFDTNLHNTMKSHIVAQKQLNLDGKKENAAINTRKDSPGQYYRGFPGKDVITENNMKKKEAEKREETESHEINEIKTPSLDTVREEGSWFFGIFGDELDYEEHRKKINQELSQLLGEGNRKLVYTDLSGGSRARTFARTMQADEAERSPVNGNNVLNIDAQFTVDGIGGLSAFQSLQIENIPRVFRNEGVFMIDSISHSVSIDDWTTEVKTKFLVKNQLPKNESES